VFNPGGTTPVLAYTAGERLQRTGTTSRRTSASRGCRTQNGWLRKVLGDPGQATIRASYGVSFNSDGLSFFGVWRQPGNSITTSRTSKQHVSAGRRANHGRCSCAIRRASTTPGIPVNRRTDGDRLQQRREPVPPTSDAASRSYSIISQRSLSQKSAVEVLRRHASGRWHDDRRLERAQFDDERIPRGVQGGAGELLANTAAGRGNSFAYFGPGTGGAAAGIWRTSAQPVSAAGNAALYGHELDQHHTDNTAGTQSQLSGAATPVHERGVRTNMLTAGFPSNFFVLNCGEQRLGHDQRLFTNTTRCSSSTAPLSIRAGHELCFAKGYLDARHAATRSTARPVHGRAARAQADSDLRLPFGHGKPMLGNAHGALDKIVGGWSINGTGRVQSGSPFSMGNVRLVGMDLGELRDNFKIRIDPVTNIVYTLPQDIIDNTIKAFSVNATGYTNGAPTGRYFAPASSPNCRSTAPRATSTSTVPSSPLRHLAQEDVPAGRTPSFQFPWTC
jgi:hypothetical protein